MSAAPRPYSRPSRIVGVNGSLSHSVGGPVGTTSVCPAKHNRGRAVPRRAKQFAWAMMTLGCAWAWWVLPEPWRWLPALVCLAVAAWLWQLPDADTR